MKKSIYFISICLVTLCMSCDVSERIVFNEDMGGRYETVIDLSKMMSMGGPSRSSDKEKEESKMDTLMVFNEMLAAKKDSIALLPEKDRAQLEALRDMTMQMIMDENKGAMIMTIAKEFDDFQDIERIAYDMDKAFDSAKNNKRTKNNPAANAPGGKTPGMNKVIYTFSDNTFRRTDPKSLTEHLEDDGVLSEKTKLDLDALNGNDPNSKDPDEMMKGVMSQMADELEKSTMKLEYVFPRKVLSVSPEGAIIAQDGKTVTFEIDWKTLLEEGDKTLENFEVVLEEE